MFSKSISLRCALFMLLSWLLLPSCVDMDKLSDEANLSTFSVKEVITPSVSLGSVRIDNDAKSVVIALEHGKYLEQILFSADIKIDERAEKLLNIDPDSVLVIDRNNDGMIDSQDKVTFYIRAKSGLPVEWSLILDPVDYSDNTDISDFIVKEAPADFAIARKGFVYKESETDCYVKIIAPEQGNYPMTLTADVMFTDADTKMLTYDESNKLVPAEQPCTLIFNNSRDILYINTESADGKRAMWPVFLASGEAIYAGNEAKFRDEQKRTVNIDNPQVLVTKDNGNQYLGSDVDSINNEIVVKMRGAGENGAIAYPVEVAMGFNLRSNQVAIGYSSGQKVSITGDNDSHNFYLYDRVNDIKKSWKIRVQSYRSSEADVKSFSLSRYSPSTIKFERDKTDINIETGVITLIVSEGMNDFPCTMRATIRVSSYAETLGLNSGEDFIINSISDVKDFKVRAEDGTIKDWQIRLRFSGELNDEAKVETFRILDYKGQKGMLQMETSSVINHEQKTITLTVTNKGNDLPLTFHAAMSISYKASFVGTQYSNATLWSFRTLSETKQITVRSEDGLTENTYIVQINDNSPAASSDAELISFKATGFTSGYTVTQTTVDQQNKKILFTVTVKGASSFAFTPQLTLSEGATTVGLISGTRYNYGNVKDVKTFDVVSEDGQTVNTWTMMVRYVPDVPNGSMERWSTDTYSKQVPTGWSSSNNSITTAVKKQSGSVDGTTCAYLETTSVLGNIAGGSMFLGWFKMDLSQLGEPKNMSHFGIPFDAYPSAVTADLKYVSGGNNDMACIEIHMLHYDGRGTFDYHTFGEKDANGIYRVNPSKEPGITVVGHGRDEFGSTNGWVTKRLPVTWYYDNPLTGYTKEALPVTHIYISYCTSYRADQIEGAVGSKMWVDNVRLEYDE